MTREIKLALILGSALVLVVGVLISDHLSAARRTGTGDVSGQLSAVISKTTVLSPTPGHTDGGNWRAEAADLPRLKVEEPVATLKTWGPAPTQLALANTPTAVDEVIDAGRQQGIEFEHVGGLIQTETKPGATQVVDASWPTSKEHVVRDGDTLWQLAKKYYNDGTMHDMIASANRGVLKGSGLVVGTTLRIPEKATGLASAAASEAAQGAEGDASKYVVKPGDTLGSIARRTLGSERRWNEIYALNENRLSDAESLSVGTELRLPPR